jgi:hypothetical protein
VAVVPATQEVIHRESDHGLRLALEKNIRPYLKKVNLSKKKKKTERKAGGVVQVVECLLGIHEPLSSNFSTAKKKRPATSFGTSGT